MGPPPRGLQAREGRGVAGAPRVYRGHGTLALRWDALRPELRCFCFCLHGYPPPPHLWTTCGPPPPASLMFIEWGADPDSDDFVRTRRNVTELRQICVNSDKYDTFLWAVSSTHTFGSQTPPPQTTPHSSTGTGLDAPALHSTASRGRQMHTESLDIMQLLDSMYPTHGPRLVPPAGRARDAASDLLQLERRLFGHWCGLVFRPARGGDRAKREFLSTLQEVDAALARSPGPWFLGGDAPSLVDLQYVSHVERMLASALYWKGLRLRNSGAFPGLDRWLDAFEQRPSYQVCAACAPLARLWGGYQTRCARGACPGVIQILFPIPKSEILECSKIWRPTRRQCDLDH